MSEIDAIALDLGTRMQIAIGLGRAPVCRRHTTANGGPGRGATRSPNCRAGRTGWSGIKAGPRLHGRRCAGGRQSQNLALTLAAAASIAYHGLSGRRAVLAALIFVLLGSTGTVGAVLLLRRFGGAGASLRLDALKRFMLRNNNVLMMAVFVLIGLTVTGNGLAALGTDAGRAPRHNGVLRSPSARVSRRRSPACAR